MKKYLWLLILNLFLLGGAVANEIKVSNKYYSLEGFSEEQKVLVGAIQQGDLEQVKELAKKTDLQLLDEKSLPLLTVAMFEAREDLKSTEQTTRLEIVTELMQAGAPFDKRGRFRMSPLAIALDSDYTAYLRALLEGELDPNYIMNGFSSPLLFRILDDDKLELVKLLVKYGADVNAKDSVGSNAAQEAMYSHTSPKVSYYLISQGADVASVAQYARPISFAMLIYREEKHLFEAIEAIKAGRSGYPLEKAKENLEYTQKIKAIMIEKGIQWPPEF